jgi:hypothetical protein
MTVSPDRLISRSEWGARYADGFGDRPMPFTEFYLHHSVTIAPDLLPPFTDDLAAIRTLESIGQSRFGGGISYSQPVTPAGLTFVGVSPHRRGAHTKGHNTSGFAFVLVGDYSKRPPTALQEEDIARRMVELHRQGKATRHTLNGGHRDVSSTACPGDAGYARIPYINRRANTLWDSGYAKPGSPLPPLPAPTPTQQAGLLEVDGFLGSRTITRLQAELKSRGFAIVVDGRLSRPSMAVEALQRYLTLKGVKDGEGQALRFDGLGLQSNEGGRYPATGTTDTVEALQRYLGTTVDGYLSSPSGAVKKLQHRLNADTF